jgi:hypothetical protein
MPIHRIYGTGCCARWSVEIVRRPLLTDLKSAEFESIRCGTDSRRRDSVAVLSIGGHRRSRVVGMELTLRAWLKES